MKLKIKQTFITLVILTLLSSTTSFANPTKTNEPENTTVNSTENKNETENETVNFNLYSKSCILVERSTGQIAYEKNADTQMYPASTTKVLTAILAVENCKMTDMVTITPEMVYSVPAGYTIAYLQPGNQLSVEQLLNLLLIPSANDAGFALAIHISGSVENFADLMNKKAAEIGCTNSHFVNPSGIHNENHYSTAKDMALIALYSLRYPQITDIVCKTSYTLQMKNSVERTFKTTNTLITPTENSYYEYANGLKTGFTEPAGSCLIATAKKDNMEFLAVVLDAPSPTNGINYRDIDCKTLFEYAFTNYDNIIKIDEKVVDNYKKSTILGLSIDTIMKIGISLLGIYLIFSLYKSQKKRNIKCKN